MTAVARLIRWEVCFHLIHFLLSINATYLVEVCHEKTVYCLQTLRVLSRPINIRFWSKPDRCHCTIKKNKKKLLFCQLVGVAWVCCTHDCKSTQRTLLHCSICTFLDSSAEEAPQPNFARCGRVWDIHTCVQKSGWADPNIMLRNTQIWLNFLQKKQNNCSWHF